MKHLNEIWIIFFTLACLENSIAADQKGFVEAHAGRPSQQANVNQASGAVDIFTRRQLGVVRVFTARLLKFSIFLPKFLAAGYKQYVLMADDTSSYLLAKWKIWYMALDLNHDDKLTTEDAVDSRDTFNNLHNLNADETKLTTETIDGWWNDFIFRNSQKDISKSEFIRSLKAEDKNDRKTFRKRMQRSFNALFDIIDTNKDRAISEDEFSIAFKAFGIENSIDFFQAYGPKDGSVRLSKIVNSWICFVSDEAESSSGDIVKQHLMLVLNDDK